MKIAIVGYGKMGQAIAMICRERGYERVIIDPHSAEADYRDPETADLSEVDVGIEFTSPDAVVGNINCFAARKIPLVVGTTGWYEQIPEIKQRTETEKASVLYGSNFSIGVNVFFKVVEQAAKIANNFSDFDVSGLEFHHNQKVDSPSGTAMTTAKILTDNIDRKSHAVFDKLDRKPAADEIHFASLRTGSEPGMHEVFFDSPAETVSVKVAARNRSGYALGSVVAAEWLVGKTGFYSFEELIDEII